MAVDYFLKIDGIEGESADSKHKNEIDILSWSWGATQTGSMSYGGGGGAGKVSMQDFHFTMRVNKASPKLMLACATGKHIGSATLLARKAGEQPLDFFKLTFTDLLISSYQTGGSGSGDEVPIDSISFNYSKIKFEYQEQDAKGTGKGFIPATYNLKENKSE